LYALDKIFSFFGLRGIDMGVRRQNIRTKGVIGKILGNKELGEVRSEVAAFLVDGLDALRTVPVWAFCFLSKGCSSQFRGLFWRGLWKTPHNENRVVWATQACAIAIGAGHAPSVLFDAYLAAA
jgi:hypothetical protein